MRFTGTALPGMYVVDCEPAIDERGLFARTYCAEEFSTHGLVTGWPQCNTSLSRRSGTVRGLHYQAEPHGETKLIRCTHGAAFDVAVDIRPDSPTFRHWTAVELSADNRRMAYIPAGFAHGFQTLADDTELFYQMSAPYRAESARGIRWDDPDVAIAWPLAVTAVSERDRALPLLREAFKPETINGDYRG